MLKLTGNSSGMLGDADTTMTPAEEADLRERFDEVVTQLFERMDKTGD